LLEVGLGGRLDAVNIINPDVSLISSIGIDHVSFLGNTREAIGREKAVYSEPKRPQ
jgi:Folylpolyglutamate synthase